MIKSELEFGFDSLSKNCKAVPKVVGVYAIQHKPDGKLYIGSTVSPRGFQRRIAEHLRDLRANRHYNKKLQSAFNNSGPGAFAFLILESTERKSAQAREKHFIEKWDTCNTGFNNRPAFENLWRMTEEQRTQLIARIAKPFALEYNGVVYTGKNLNAFARLHNLDQSSLSYLVRGKFKQYKGWTLPGKGMPSLQVRSPNDEVIVIPHNGISQFARQNGLTKKNTLYFLKEPGRLHKGWSRADSNFTLQERTESVNKTNQEIWADNAAKVYKGREVSLAKAKLRRRKFYLLKDGIRYDCDGIADCAKRYNIATGTLYKLMRGDKSEHLGYTLVMEK